MGLEQMSAASQIRWAHRFLEDRKELLKAKLQPLVSKLLEFDTTHAISGSNTYAFATCEQYINNNNNNQTAFDPFIDNLIKKIMIKFFANARQPKTIESILRNAAYQDHERTPEERILRTIATETEQQLANAHPALRQALVAFLQEKATPTSTPTTDPLQRLLMKGEGFIPTPNSYATITNTLVHSVRNTALLSFLPGHPGIESQEAKLYHQRMVNICRDVQWKDNLDKEERRALKDATKDPNTVFVPTDKTGKLLAISRATMAAAIGKFIQDKQGSSFDLITDPISMGTLLTQQKKAMSESVPFFQSELVTWQNLLSRSMSDGQQIAAANAPSTVHDKHFSKGTPALEKIIKILSCEAKYLPSFGPLKPHIKDHKLKRDIYEVLEEAMKKGEIPELPLRMTHKATCGPTAALAEIIGPILEALANCCLLSLSQASSDIAKFCAA